MSRDRAQQAWVYRFFLESQDGGQISCGIAEDLLDHITDALRRHNKVVGDVVTRLKLTKDQRRMLHDRVHGEKLTYREVLEVAKDMFNK